MVVKELSRYKHWFQNNNPRKYLHDTIVLAQFRNPYDWLKAMERVPHHSPAHIRTLANATTDSPHAENDWRIFLTKPWTMERVGTDVGRRPDERCQEGFVARDIISCDVRPLPSSHYKHKIRYSENEPFYEMRNDGSGLPVRMVIERVTIDCDLLVSQLAMPSSVR